MRVREQTMPAEQVRAITRKMIDHLPDDPRLAVAVCALCYANVAVATGHSDEGALEAVRRALAQMRRNMGNGP